MIVWGGYYEPFGFYGDGDSYDPVANAWTEIGSSTFLHLYQKP